MITTIETYVRSGRARAQKLVREPMTRLWILRGACFVGNLILSGAALARGAMPLALGPVLALRGWKSAAAAAGGAAGYLAFWGDAGFQGLLWMICGLAVVLFLGKERVLEDTPLMLPAVGGLIVAAGGLFFQVFLEDTTPVPLYLLRTAAGALAPCLFQLVRDRRDPAADWVAMGCMVLALAGVAPLGFSFGCLAAGIIGVAGPLPAAALAGLALDLSRLTEVSMTAVLCLAQLTRYLPGRWVRYIAPGAVYILVMHLSGHRDWQPFFPLALGGLLGILVPRMPEQALRRGETGLTQVRLELMAGCMSQTGQLLLEESGIPIDEEALLLRAQKRACTGCPNRKTCRERLMPLPNQLLHSPLVEVASLSIPCKKPGRLILELRRTQEQLRILKADRERQREYRTAVVQQYSFLADWLQQQADWLPRRPERLRQRFTAEVAICSAGREAANGDRCISFPVFGCRHYVMICDGMGTGPEAAREGRDAARLLRQMLIAGFPPEHALKSLNSLLVLRGRAAAVTVDLAQIHLDSGRVTLYKWGAAPSWLLGEEETEKIGTATPPPGLSVTEGRETVERLSLRQGDTLILVSDGVDPVGMLDPMGEFRHLPPGELAAKLLEQGARDRQDDATVAAVCLRPGAVPTS